MNGICRLCLRDEELKVSHIWPRFLYKDFVSDMAKGGKVVKVSAGPPDDAKLGGAGHVTRPWLCFDCEQRIGKSETAVAPLLRAMDRARDRTHKYDKQMLRFVTSISWRCILFQCERFNRGLIEAKFPAVKYWRHFLSGQRADLSGYTQHAFAIFNDEVGVHRMLSAHLDAAHGFIISQAGPLMILGRLDRTHESFRDALIWQRSEVQAGGGAIKAVDEWRVGLDITEKATRALARQQATLIGAIRRMPAPGPGEIRRGRPRRP